MSVTYPRGFRASGVVSGLKESGKADLALIVSEGSATASAMFTQNRVVAAPVTLSRLHVARGSARAVVVNSGNANACTGAQGDADALEMAELTASQLGCEPADVLVASTGIIGRPLAMERVRPGIALAASALAADGGADASLAICTTDAYPKTGEETVALAGGEVRLGAMAKGAGMIRPDMATMICVVTTDAAIGAPRLDRLLQHAVAHSFNRISVDGSASTNDTVFVLANGASGVAVEPADEIAFGAALDRLLLRLAKLVVSDGEGAARIARYEVTGAGDGVRAEAAVRAVAENQLVRCALHGADPNWGRILMALGASTAEVAPERIDLWIEDVQLVAAGAGLPGAEDAARVALAGPEISVRIGLGQGDGSAVVYASDLSTEYVRVNSEYST
ncbi:MAG TPA: bifunctional glutamate N-acetyltransferase/amino-acid acetyltransferase ArgJ [Gaiellales bacterium]|jgi:glutamate N-acetyltransferase/amino-acid N-acetyltransferase